MLKPDDLQLRAGDYEPRSLGLLGRGGTLVSILAASKAPDMLSVLWRLAKGCVRPSLCGAPAGRTAADSWLPPACTEPWSAAACPHAATMPHPGSKLLHALGLGPRYCLEVVSPDGGQLAALAALAERGALRPSVDRVLPLERIACAGLAWGLARSLGQRGCPRRPNGHSSSSACLLLLLHAQTTGAAWPAHPPPACMPSSEAMEYVEGGHARGKVVLRIGPDDE